MRHRNAIQMTGAPGSFLMTMPVQAPVLSQVMA